MSGEMVFPSSALVCFQETSRAILGSKWSRTVGMIPAETSLWRFVSEKLKVKVKIMNRAWTGKGIILRNQLIRLTLLLELARQWLLLLLALQCVPCREDSKNG